MDMSTRSVCAAVLWYSVVWCGVVCCGVVWYGMVWYGMVWHGMVLRCFVPYNVRVKVATKVGTLSTPKAACCLHSAIC